MIHHINIKSNRTLYIRTGRMQSRHGRPQQRRCQDAVEDACGRGPVANNNNNNNNNTTTTTTTNNNNNTAISNDSTNSSNNNNNNDDNNNKRRGRTGLSADRDRQPVISTSSREATSCSH